MRAPIAAVCTAYLLVLVACGRDQATGRSGQVIVFAAASSTEVIREAGKRFEAQKGIKVICSFDSSSSLAKQLKAGSPADVFLSADETWMDDVAAAGVIRSETRRDLFGNALVLIAPANKRFDVQLSKDFDFLPRLTDVKRIAIGDPAHVPAGRYAQQALKSLGWWDALEPRMIPTLDVRAALRLVEIGEADAGIVYATDAKQSDIVVVVAEFPAECHAPIRYPIAQCNDSMPAAKFIQFLQNAEMSGVFEKAGFTILSTSGDR